MATAGVVLTYHALGVVDRTAALYNTFVPPPLFESQMDFLRRHRSVVGLDAILQGPVTDGPPSVAITFDDGYRSVLTEAAPILERHGFPATVFVPTRWIGDRNRWDPPNDLPLEIMTSDELAELAGRGFEVASHGHAHIDFSTAGAEEARGDLEASIEVLAGITGRRPRHLAYPYGRSSDLARRLVAEAGFEAAFSLEQSGGRFAHPRVPVYPIDGRHLFRFKTSGRYVNWRRSKPVSTLYDLVRPLARRRYWP